MFAVSVFVVTAIGGILIALGFADLLRSLVPRPERQVKDW
jgi:hypothetical protein